jgi:hypothetical protein
MRTFLNSALLCALCAPCCLSAATQFYYVDPNFAGGGRNGEASTPWQSLAEAGAWTAINTALGSSNVYIYFSARAAGADTNQLTATACTLERVDMGANTLSLDGMSQYNSNDSTPSWSAYSGTSRFWIHSTYPMNSNNTSPPYTNRVNIAIRGFYLQAVDGQVAGLYGTSNVVFEFNWCTTDAGASTGPTIHFAVPNQHSTNGNINGIHHQYITIRSNVIFNTFGEGIYIGASTGDPPGVAGYHPTGSNIVIAWNLMTNCGLRGGQGDYMDIKDGNIDLWITNNTMVATSAFSGGDNQGILIESGTLIGENLIIGASGMERNGIAVGAAWDNTAGRTNLVIRNNRIITPQVNGIRNVGASATAYNWTNVFFYNNSVYNPVSGSGINLSGNFGPSQIKNNILFGAGISEYPYDTATGLSVSHSNNVIYNASDSVRYAFGEGGSFGASDVLTFEPSAVKTDPEFTSTATLQIPANSSAVNAGAALTQFSVDYLGTSRPQGSVWDIGAFEFPILPGTISARIGGGRPTRLMHR